MVKARITSDGRRDELRRANAGQQRRDEPGETGTQFPMWVIYDHPKDFPDYFIARLWLVDDQAPQMTNSIIACKSLEELRDRMHAMRLVSLLRHPNDDPKIIETWV